MPEFQWLDAYGRPVNTKALTEEQAAPTLRGVRQASSFEVATGLTPVRLAHLLRDSIDGDPENYLSLAESMEERDLHYAGVLGVRKRQVAGLEVTVEAATDAAEDVAAADLVREIVDRDAFQDELVDVLDAIGKGFSATEIVWDTSEGQWRPTRLKYRDSRWFVFDPLDGETLLLRDVAGNVPLKPFGWIVHQAKAKSGLPIRGGLARAVAWSFLFKSFTNKDWAIFAEAYGQPLRLGKYADGASEPDKDTLLRAVANIGADYAAIVPQSMTIDFVEANISGSHELYEKRCDWLDRQVSKVVRGQTGTTDAIAGGYAGNKVHRQVSDDIEIADARQLTATLQRDLFRPAVDLNFGRRARRLYPKVKIGRPDEVDVEKLVKNVTMLVPLGLKVGMSTMRDKIGMPDPGKDEELLTAPAPRPAVVDPEDEPQSTPPKLPTSTQSAAIVPTRADAIDRTIDDLLAGFEPMVAPIAAGLGDELAQAGTLEEATAIISERIRTMDVTVLAEHLARAAFAARLAGETDEPLTGRS